MTVMFIKSENFEWYLIPAKFKDDFISLQEEVIKHEDDEDDTIWLGNVIKFEDVFDKYKIGELNGFELELDKKVYENILSQL